MISSGKPKIGLEPMPEHMLKVPSDAPRCYGDELARPLNPDCSICTFNSRCAEYVDRIFTDMRCGIESGSPSRYRSVWSEGSPLVAGLKQRCQHLKSGPLGGASCGHSKPRFVDRLDLDSRMAAVIDAALTLGLITIGGAYELGVEAEAIKEWLCNSREPLTPDNHFAAIFWLTGAIARRALLRQGRPNAFRPALHREVLRELEGVQLSPSDAARQAREVEALYRRFRQKMFDAEWLLFSELALE